MELWILTRYLAQSLTLPIARRPSKSSPSIGDNSRTIFSSIDYSKRQGFTNVGSMCAGNPIASHADQHQAISDFPPRSNKGLRALYQKIVSDSRQDHYRHSLIRYILKDLGLNKHSMYQLDRKLHLPKKYQLFIDGIWLLDRLQIEV